MKHLSIFTTILILIGLTLPISASAGAPLEGKVIALDAGHGGADVGAVNENPGHRLFEKDVTISVANVLREMLQKDGARVVMIREGDETVDLYERPARINASGADISVSIHGNSAAPSVNGTETYFADEAGKRLASALNARLWAGLDTKDRGVKQEASFVLTRMPTMPSVITEASFITNDEEAKAFKNGDRVEVEADCLYQGIKDYFSV